MQVHNLELGPDVPLNHIDISKTFLKLCKIENFKSRLFTEPKFSNIIATLLSCDLQEVLIPTLQGIRKLTMDSTCCNYLRKDYKVMKFLNELRRRYYGNDQLSPILSSILNTINPSESQLNSSIQSQKSHSRLHANNFGNHQPKNIVKYILFIPGISNNILRHKVEALLLRVKGLKSFCTDPKKETIQIFTSPDFRLTLAAKILFVQANVDEVFLVLRENSKEERK
ncbi:hypothetical protein HZS_6997, partial [Henneguya salminicola]